jgi:hypothetical protein
MHLPCPSVVALARFEFSENDLQYAREQLQAESSWKNWIAQIELHGLAGFANKHISEFDLPVPSTVKMELKALVIRHRSAAQARYQTLCEIDTVLNDANISYVGLKGAVLMPYLYREGGLRPMRDMDILLRRKDLEPAADCLRQIGYDLPKEQPSMFMRDMHQLPNATKKVKGFISSVELHGDGISREVPGHYYYPESAGHTQTVVWNDLEFNGLEDLQMIHQVSKHLEGLHSGAVLKLINVMDVVGLAQMILHKGRWQELAEQFPHVINTLRCLHIHTPLPVSLQQQLEPLPTKTPAGVGQIMGSMRNALLGSKPLKKRLSLLLDPSDWWLHLYYNIDPDKSLWWIKGVRHPLRVANWLTRRLYSRLQGG